MDWLDVNKTPPEIDKEVLVYVGMHPKKWDHDYSGLVDGSDRTDEELVRRKYARSFISSNPVQIATPYKAVGGIRYMIRSNSDSVQGFIADKEVLFWCSIPTI